MKKINDISGVVRGIQLIKKCFCKQLNESRCKSQIMSVETRSESKKVITNVMKSAMILPEVLNNSAFLIFIQSLEMGKFLLSSKVPQASVNDVKIEVEPVSFKIEKESLENDTIDRELIERYRQEHKETLKKKNLNIKVDTMIQMGRESRVPSTEVGRALNFASLFARLGVGAAAERTRRVFGFQSSGDESNMFLSQANAKRIVESLCRVRGAALKLGQMLSIQDSEFVHPQLQEIFERVRQHADFMPISQMHKVMTTEFGENWRELFQEFDDRPFAAASIGQVHRAVTADKLLTVAVKIQYPGVKRSIDSDINNLMSLLRFTKALPAGLHADRAIEVAKKELAYECDYRREAEFALMFAEKLRGDPVFVVPKVIPHLSTEQVITTELVDGITLDKCQSMSQEVRDWVGTQMLRLCLTELFELFAMQTDPNWANFLFNVADHKIYLLDFGASRTFDKIFVDNYLRVIKAASVQDKETILHYSRKLGFLTGFETKLMEQAHIDAVSILGEVFTSTSPFDFSRQSTTKRIKELIPVMLEHRLTPPPEETYSLHRKLSGGFLLCTKLRARVSCAQLFRQMYNRYHFD